MRAGAMNRGALGKAKQQKARDSSGSGETAGESTENEQTPPLRRSGRVRTSTNLDLESHVTSSAVRSSRPETRSRRDVSEAEPSKKKPRPTQKKMEDYDEDYLNLPMNEQERSEWKGWCEIESDPAYFNSIIREWGVKGVKIQEVIGLDDELLTMIPKPIYGLIFLFSYREDSPEKMERCPDDVWFAHQIAQNSCASVALLNLIMNIPDIDVGDALEDLKMRTSTDMNPRQRGQIVKGCEFVREVHNSFARKSDLFTVVKDLKQPQTPQKAVKRKGRKGQKAFTNKKRKKVVEDDEEESAYHFIAFVPINGKLWKLDGMDAQPMNLGPYEDDWMDLARPDLTARMAAYEDDAISFSLQALCCSPLETIPTLLAENIAKLLCLESTLTAKDPDWSIYLDPDSSIASATHLLLGPDENTCVTPELLSDAKSKLETSENAHPKITNPDNSVMELMNMREKAVKEQNKLRGAYMEEIVAVQQDEERAKNRRQSDQNEAREPSLEKSALDRKSSPEEKTPARQLENPLGDHNLSSGTVEKDIPDAEMTGPSSTADTDPNTEMPDVVLEKQESESSLDIPLDAALTIHSDG